MPLNDFETVFDLRDSTDSPKGAGYSWWVQGGYSYREAAPSATNHDVVTAGGVKLYIVAPLFVTPEHFFAVGDGVADDTAAVRSAIAFGNAHRVMVDLAATYGLSDQVLIDSAAQGGSGGTVRLRGRRGLRVTFRALSTSAQVAIGRQPEVVLEDVHFDGAGADDEYLADAGIVALAKGGRSTGITGANNLTLLRCLVERTRGAAVQLLRDTTEFHLDHCIIRRCGRYDAAATGAARFIDPETPALTVAGNGTMNMCVVSASTGRLLHVYKGDADGDGVFEEVNVRAFGCRFQNGFRGLVHVEDQRASSTENDFLDVELFGCYFENVGTVQDSVTSGGSPLTQKTGDMTDVFLAEGPTARLRIVGDTKILARRATSGFRAIDGGEIVVDVKGAVYKTQESLSDGAVMFDTTGGAAAGVIRVLTMPTFVSNMGVVGDMDEKGPAGRKMLTSLIKEDRGLQVRSVVFHLADTLGTLIDGANTAQVTSTNGVAALTLNTTEVSPLHPQASSIEVQGAGGNMPDFVVKTFSLPPRTAGRWIRISYLAAWKQVGPTFGSAGQPISGAMQVLNGATNPAALGNGGVPADDVNHGQFDPTPPGVDAVTPWLETQAVVFVMEAGSIDVRTYLTTSNQDVDDKMFLQEVRAAFVA